jgi:hypothetical protein
MNVQVNAKSAAKSVLEFVKEAGGNAKNTEALELVARICGFDSYRAMLAVSQRDQAPRKVVEPPLSSRAIEAPGRIAFRSPMIDWEWNENPDAGLGFIPERRRTKFEVVLEDFSPQFRVSIRPVGVNLDTCHGKSILDLQLEINDGVPCVHLSNDPDGEMVMSVFGTGAGLVIRQDNDNHVPLSKASASLYELAQRNGAEYLSDSRFSAVENDTFAQRTHVDMLVTAIARDTAKVTPVSTGPFVQVGEEEASASLAASKDPALRDCVVHAKFDESVGEMQSWLDVSIVEPNGTSSPGADTAGFTVFGKDAEDSAVRQAFVDALAPVAAYFVVHDKAKYMLELVSELVLRPNALDLVRNCQEIVQKALSVHLACDAVEAMLAVLPTGLVLSGGSEDGVTCRHCNRYYSLDDEGIGLGIECPSKKCPSHQH